MASAWTEFPHGCLTSTYVLGGFQDFAYVVFTLVQPPGTQHDLLKESKGSRLKSAVQEFRKASFLVTLDVEKLELFLFCRKSDLLRDQKVFIGKVGPILRSYYLIKSYTAGGKANLLLKPEQSRIYGLFTEAVLSSVWPACHVDGGTVSLGPRAFISLHEAQWSESRIGSVLKTPRSWQFCDIDVQILESGNILVTSTVHGDMALFSMSDLMTSSLSDTEDFEKRVLCLAPIGQVARYGHRRMETPFPPGQVGILEARKGVWREILGGWLVQQGMKRGTSDQQVWIEVEIPAVMQKISENADMNDEIVWKRTWWPAELCFSMADQSHSHPEVEIEQDWDYADPWEFVEAWHKTARDRTDENLRMMEERNREPNPEDHHSEFEPSEDDLQLGYTPHFQVHGLTDFPPSQLMYPTPPDGAIALATPGMSSYDGIDMTPAHIARAVPDTRDTIMGDNPQNIDNTQNPGVGTGVYDEDLFEDVPGEQFEPAGVADEPNWDFFDQPDFEMPDVEVPVGQSNHEAVEEGDEQGPIGRSEPFDMLSPATVQQAEAPKDLSNNTVGNASMLNLQTGSTAGELGRPFLNPSWHDQGRPSTIESAAEAGMGHPPTAELSDQANDEGMSAISNLQRSSLYDFTQANFRSQTRDSNYFTNGKYWFENANNNDLTHQSGEALPGIGPYRSGIEHRYESSSNSTSDSDVSLSGGDRSQAEREDAVPNEKRGWTEYAPVTQEPMQPSEDPVDLSPIQRDATELIEMLQSAQYDLPVLYQNLQTPLSPLQTLKNEIEDLSLIAQIVVDELSQTLFQRLHQNLFTLQSPNGEMADLLTNLSKSDATWERSDLEHFSQSGLPVDSVDADVKIDRLEDCPIRLFRAESVLTSFRTITPLWESLNLQPYSGRKDITAYCIHPSGRNVSDGCEMLLARMSETYLNCNLGTHTTGQLAGITDSGIIGWSSGDDALTGLVQMCESLGTALGRSPVAGGTTMIYLVNPSTNVSSYVELSRAFISLFKPYVKACIGKPKPNDLALQIVPISFIASPDTIVVPTQEEYLNLAIEVYNRCPPSETADHMAPSGSAVVLAGSTHRSVDFELTAEVTSPLSKDGNCLHVAYSRSIDKRWVTAAWTDESGQIALTMSYCLRSRHNGSSRRVSDVIQDIWEVSHDLMAKPRSRWRLVVARDGSYEAEEINDWLFHANSTAKGQNPSCNLILASINLNPSLTLTLPSSLSKKLTQSPFQSQPHKEYGTPTSTPQAANTTSPDQLVAATPTPGDTNLVGVSTPPEHSFDPNTDVGLTLGDPTEESWCVLLSHGLNQSRNILDVRPAMVSGYLLKRKGARDEDGVVSLGVNLIHTSIPAHQHTYREELLKEIIVQYKGLVTLAATRNCLVDSAKECVPWHISTAVKGAKVLGMVL